MLGYKIKATDKGIKKLVEMYDMIDEKVKTLSRSEKNVKNWYYKEGRGNHLCQTKEH